MSEGRGSATSMVALAVALALHCCALLVSSATWTVGGSKGWTIGPDYTAWAAGQAFATGDVLFFPYAVGAHDVAEVDKASYEACSAAGANAVHTDGNTTVTLSSSGTYYFLCSFLGHCTEGMKLAVTVGAAATPAPSPNTSVETPPPAPSPPASAPAPASAQVPTPASTPSPASAPVPAPVSAEAPASTPSPASASVPAPVTVGTPPSASGPPVGSPPNSADRLSSAGSLAAALLFLAAAVWTAL